MKNLKIRLNGKYIETSKFTVTDILNEKGVELQNVVVEYNFEVLKKEQWDTTILKEDSNIEVLKFVGGG